MYFSTKKKLTQLLSNAQSNTLYLIFIFCLKILSISSIIMYNRYIKMERGKDWELKEWKRVLSWGTDSKSFSHKHWEMSGSHRAESKVRSPFTSVGKISVHSARTLKACEQFPSCMYISETCREKHLLRKKKIKCNCCTL